MVAAAASLTRNEARYALDTGSDFAGELWRKSELLQWARTEGARYPLYSNWTAVVYFYLHRPARDVPMLIESRRLGEFVDTLRVRNGRVIEFAVPGIEYATMDSLLHTRGLRVVAELRDGVVLAPVTDDARPARLGEQRRDLIGGERAAEQVPWTSAHSVSCSTASCACVSTPSAITTMPRLSASATIVRTISERSPFSPMLLTNDRSILRPSRSNRCR